MYFSRSFKKFICLLRMNQLSKGKTLKTGHNMQIKNLPTGMNDQVIENGAEFETGKTVKYVENFV